MNAENVDDNVIEITNYKRQTITNTSSNDSFDVSISHHQSIGHSVESNPSSTYGGGSGGSGPMNERVARLEAIEVNNTRLLSEIKQEISNTNKSIGNLERRVTDKMDENQKWIIALIISSILVPLLLALIAK